MLDLLDACLEHPQTHLMVFFAVSNVVSMQ